MKKRSRSTKPKAAGKARPKAARKARPTEIVVRVEQQTAVALPTAAELAEPMRDGTKLTIPKTWVGENQLTHMLQTTPRQHVYTRPAKGGGTWTYVTGGYITKVLNYVFGWNWDFDVLEHGTEGGQVWVKAKLTVRGTAAGQEISKTQFGRADIKFKKDGKGMLDFGNDLKGAATDALKKCASMLGIASDVYGKTEYREETGKAPAEPSGTAQHYGEALKGVLELQLRPGQVLGPDGNPTWTCAGCDAPITDQTANYSLKVKGKRLCAECQKGA